MRETSLVEALQATLEDRKLSRGERRAVQAMVARQVRSEHEHNVIRAEAFKLARAAIADANDAAVVDWLEDVIKALEPPEDSGRAPRRAAYFAPDDNCPGRLISLLGNCRKTADICVFTITDDRVTEAIHDAHVRGVQVRVLTDNDKAFDPGSDVGRLARQGLPVRVDMTEHHMHHKFALLDSDLLLTGSYNWTRSAAEKNYENLVVLQEPGLVAEFFEEFEKIWKNSLSLRPT